VKRVGIRPALRTWLYRFGLLLGGLLFGYQVWLAVSDLRRSQWSVAVHPELLLVSLGLDIVAYILILIAWQRFMYSVGVSMRMGAIVEGYALSFLPRYIPGTIWGYASRSEWALRNYAVPAPRSWFASLMEVGAQAGTAVTIAALLIGVWQPQLAPAAWALPVLWVAGWWVLRLLARRVGEGVTVRWLAWSGGIAIYLGFWLVHGVATMQLAAAFGAPPSAPFAVYTFAFATAWLIGFVVIFLPAGLGLREASLAFLLQQLVLMPPETAALVAVSSRLLLIGAELLLLLVGMLRFGVRSRRTRDAG
jgi:hypothetical protein